MKKILLVLFLMVCSCTCMAQVVPWSKVGDWSPATNTPTLVATPALTAHQYYECTTSGTFLGITFQIGDYLYAENGSWQKLDLSEPLSLYIKQVITSQAARITALENKLPVAITPIVGGSQASTSVSLADVTGSTMTLTGSADYEAEWVVTYSAAATTTGAWFSVGGTAGVAYISVEVIGDVLATDASCRAFKAMNGGGALTSSRATSLNIGIVKANIHTTTAGTVLLRFATEVNASAITVTALQGYSMLK